MNTRLIGIPIKPFGVAKARLGSALDRRARATLGKAIAAHTVRCAGAAGVPAVVTADAGVRAWARELGAGVVAEPSPGGLDAAAAAVVRAAAGRPWAVLHADLPLLGVPDLLAVWEAAEGATALCPSHDAGTTLIAGHGDFGFAYGPGSFHRHLAADPDARVVLRQGLALDLDTITDLSVARRLPGGRWLDDVMPLGTLRP